MRSANTIFTVLFIVLLALTSLQVVSATLPGPFWPLEIALDNDGNLYALAAGNSSVQDFIHVYAPDGREIRTIGAGNRSLQEIAFDSYGNFYLRDGALTMNQSPVQSIRRIDKDGSVTVITSVSRGENVIINGLAVGLDGTVYYSKYRAYGGYPIDEQYLDASRVLAVDGNGTTRVAYVENDTTGFTGMAVNANGTIYAVRFGSYITVISPDGNVSAIGKTGEWDGVFDTLIDVVAGQDGYIYTAEGSQGGINRIRKLSPNGTQVMQWEGCGPDKFASARSVAADKNGRIYVADKNNQRIVWFTGDYRFGDNVTQNMAGEGVLWGTVVFSGYNNGTWAAMVNQENNPGLPYALIGIAFLGIIAVSIITVTLIRFYMAGKSFSRAGNAVVIGTAAVVVTAVVFVLVFLLSSLFHDAFGYGYLDPVDRYQSAALGSQLYSLFIVFMLAAGSLAAYAGRKNIKDDKGAVLAGGLTGLCVAGVICTCALAISLGQLLMSYGFGTGPGYFVSTAPGIILFALVLPATFAMPIAAAGAFITRRYTAKVESRSSNGNHRDLTMVMALAISMILVTLITADFSLTYNVVPIAPVLFMLPLLVTLPVLAAGVKWPRKTGAVPPGFIILALSAVAIVLLPMAEVLLASVIGIL